MTRMDGQQTAESKFATSAKRTEKRNEGRVRQAREDSPPINGNDGDLTQQSGSPEPAKHPGTTPDSKKRRPIPGPPPQEGGED